MTTYFFMGFLMKSQFTIGSLGSEGWIDNPHRLLDYTVSHFLLSNYSQSYICFGNVRSFSWILETYNKDVYEMSTILKTTLTSYLEEHFSSVSVSIDIINNETSKISLQLFIECLDKYGIKTNLNWLLRTNMNKISTIIEYNNYGEQTHVIQYP